MTDRNAAHGTFSLERTYSKPPAKVFAAWAEPEKKMKWFVGPAQATTPKREFEFRIGGREELHTDLGNGRVARYDAIYRDIVPDERIVYAYDMYVNDTRISVSVATVEFFAEAGGTRMKLTEQGVFLDGHDDKGSREEGTIYLLGNFSAFIESE